MARVVVVIEGGIVQDILSTEPVEVAVIDYDTEGAEESDITQILQMEPGEAPEFASALASVHPYTVDPERVQELFAAIV